MLAPRIDHEFVEFVPDELDANTLYVSIRYATVVHLCLCGCGHKVVTPLAPTDWTLGYDGETVSLSPSIGNWSFPCQSHYWIRNGRVYESKRWDRQKIASNRAHDQALKADAMTARTASGRPSDADPSRTSGWFYRAGRRIHRRGR